MQFTTTIERAGRPVDVPLRGVELERHLLDVIDAPDAHPGMRLIAGWLSSSAIRSQRTRDAYATDVEQFLAWLMARNRPLLAVTRADVERWLKHLELDLGLAGSTRARKVAAISSLFEYLLDADLVDKNPTRRIDRAYQSEQTEALSQRHATELLTAAHRTSHLDDALVSMLLLAGLRVSEATGTRRDHVQQLGEVRLLRVTIKGGKHLDVPLDGPGAALGAAIDRHHVARPVDSPWILSDDDGQPLARHQVTYRLGRLARSIGLGNVSPHQLRATFITLSSDAGVPLLDTQIAVGHADPRTTMGYYDRGEAWKRHPAAVLADTLGAGGD